ncbi:PREDICTED: uncharacterized protein LOC105361615 [Ceratosolen solmsi marchali]|uniref:Uncharacterized protein LOC105361615 n=1 Tax=Ceratosolen solmsi marchali TaxID=326594 RepID=A0AAJ6YFL1_9HYME|nr:PREDICTED: uncharacterized protein LOC105361615 [Ceratosolen solmsi marchali]
MTSDESEYSMEKTTSLSYQSKLSITNDLRYKEIKEEMERDVKSASTTPLNKSPMPKMNSMINEQSINDDSVCSKSDDTIFLSNIMNDQSVDDRVKKPKYLKECHIIVNSPLVKNPLQSSQYNSPADITRTPLIENKNIENDSKSFVIKIEKNVNNETKLLSKTISPLLNRAKQQDSLNSDRSPIKENSEDEIVIYYEFLPNKSSQKCLNVVKVEDGKEYEQSFSNKENSMINEIIPPSSLSKHTMTDNKIKHTNALKEATIINLSNSPELRKQKKLKKSKKRRHCKHNCELSSKRIINTNQVLESNESEMVDLVSTDEIILP